MGFRNITLSFSSECVYVFLTLPDFIRTLPVKMRICNKENASKVSNLTFLYEDVDIVFCDEISMVGSSKFARINFQLQDIKGCRDFMGGLSFVAVGDFRQLPPVLEQYAYMKTAI